MTVFIFTDKAQKILGEAQGNVFFDAIVVFACIAYLLYVLFGMIRKKKRSGGWTVIGVILFLFFFSGWIRDEIGWQQYLNNTYTELTAAYQNRDYKLTEGVVHVLHMEPEGGHDSGDIIQIGEVEFELSCFHSTFGYNKTIVFGGVLSEGTFARVFYYQTADPSSRGRTILRIDLLEQPTVPFKKIDPLLPCAG